MVVITKVVTAESHSPPEKQKKARQLDENKNDFQSPWLQTFSPHLEP